MDVLRAMKGFRNLEPEEKKESPAYQAVEKLKKIFQIETPLQKFSVEERLRIRKKRYSPLWKSSLAGSIPLGRGTLRKGALCRKP